MRLFGRHDDGAHGNGNGAHHGAPNGLAVADGTRPDRANGLRANGHARSNGVSDPAILLTPDGWLVGHLDGDVSDADLGDVLSNPLVRVVASDGPRVVDRDDVMMLVPPATADEEHIRSSRRPLPVAVDLGVAVLRGVFYALPGVSAWETWQRSTSGFVPVSAAVLDFPDGTTETAGRVLLSRHAVHSGLITG